MKPFADPRCTIVIGTNQVLERRGIHALPLDQSTPGETVSFWKPSEEDRQALAAGGTIRLQLLSPYHPPAAMTVEAAGHNKGPER